MAGICHNSAANFIHGSDTETRQCRQTCSSGVAIFTLYCSFSSSLYARLERTENPSISVLKSQQCQCVQPVFGGFLSPTGHIRNGLTAPLTAPRVLKRSPADVSPILPGLNWPSVFIVSNESPLAPLSRTAVSTLSLAHQRRRKNEQNMEKLVRTFFRGGSSHMENYLKARNGR